MARTGTVTLNLTICTDLDCIRAGHPDHTAAQVEWPADALSTGRSSRIALMPA